MLNIRYKTSRKISEESIGREGTYVNYALQEKLQRYNTTQSVEQVAFVVINEKRNLTQPKLFAPYFFYMKNVKFKFFLLKRILFSKARHSPRYLRYSNAIQYDDISVTIGLLQLAVTWYKIRHAGEQAYYYSRTGTSKTKKIQILQDKLPLFSCPSAGIIISLLSSMADFVPCDR